MRFFGIFTSLLLLLTLQSCGLLDFGIGDVIEENPSSPSAPKLALTTDDIFTMEGDTFSMKALTTTGEVYPYPVFWATEHDSVLVVKDNVFYALSEGETTVTAVSVEDLSRATCTVSVLPKWTAPAQQPFETVVLADVRVNGKYFDPETMRVAAFFHSECCAFAEPMEANGIQYVRFRVRSEFLPVTDGDPEQIRFAVHLPGTLQYEFFDQTCDYDGETHGTLGKLFKLSVNF